MSSRDDFNSSMSSPNSYSRSSNYGGNNASGNFGGNKGTYGGTNQPMRGFTTPAQSRAYDAQRQSNNLRSMDDSRGAWPGGYATPVLKKTLGPIAAPTAPASYQPPPPVTQEDIPAVPSFYTPGVLGGGGVFGVNPGAGGQIGNAGAASRPSSAALAAGLGAGAQYAGYNGTPVGTGGVRSYPQGTSGPRSVSSRRAGAGGTYTGW